MTARTFLKTMKLRSPQDRKGGVYELLRLLELLDRQPMTLDQIAGEMPLSDRMVQKIVDDGLAEWFQSDAGDRYAALTDNGRAFLKRQSLYRR